jgi:hypothetical protein
MLKKPNVIICLLRKADWFCNFPFQSVIFTAIDVAEFASLRLFLFRQWMEKGGGMEAYLQ